MKLTAAILAAGVTLGHAEPLYIYKNSRAPENNYIPSGWMGATKDITFSDKHKDGCKEGTCIKITYTPKSETPWAGIYWLDRLNNWGIWEGKHNLNSYDKFTFWAKGEPDKAGLMPRIEEFKVGGISGNYSDSMSASIGPLELTKDWKKYEINLKSSDRSQMIGGFAWSAAAEYNAEGMTFYLDECRYE